MEFNLKLADLGTTTGREAATVALRDAARDNVTNRDRLVYQAGEMQRRFLADAAELGTKAKAKDFQADWTKADGTPLWTKGTFSKAGTVANVLAAAAKAEWTVESQRMLDYWCHADDASFSLSAGNFVSDDGETHENGVDRMLAVFGCVDYAYDVAKGRKGWPGSEGFDANGKPIVEDAPEGDDDGEEPEAPEADPEVTLRMAIQQAIVALGKDAVAAICLSEIGKS
jgi:hypothetical protein